MESTTKTKPARKWLVMKSNSSGGKGMSMPESFINTPNEFLDEFYTVDRSIRWHNYNSDYEWNVADQAISIITDLHRIQVPARYIGTEMVSVIAVRDPSAKCSIEIVTDMKRKWELLNCAGNVASAPFNKIFDQFLFLYVLNASESELKHAVDYVLSEITGQKTENWDRAKCEWFFSTRSHFVADDTDEDDDDHDDE